MIDQVRALVGPFCKCKGNCQPIRHSDHNISNDLRTHKVVLNVRCLRHIIYSGSDCAALIKVTAVSGTQPDGLSYFLGSLGGHYVLGS